MSRIIGSVEYRHEECCELLPERTLMSLFRTGPVATDPPVNTDPGGNGDIRIWLPTWESDNVLNFHNPTT